MSPIAPEQKQKLGITLGTVFSPSAPIDSKRLFAGRIQQLRKVVDAINQRGQHTIIYGERGVGKTSLANVLADFLPATGQKILTPRVNCDGNDDYSSLWRKVLGEIKLVTETRGMGFTGETKQIITSVADKVGDKVDPDQVRVLMTQIGSQAFLIIIVDEFDRLPNVEDRRIFADTIKTLSDHAVPVTLVLVGVADSVEELIKEHQSVERALVQVKMPRMSKEELDGIVVNALTQVGMTITGEALDQISLLSQGLPHYAHLLGLYASRKAVDGDSIEVTLEHVESAVRDAIADAQQSIRSAYHQATMSPRRDNLYRQVLLACAFARADDLGYFAAADVRDPMSMIMGEKYDIPAFSRHLNDFCEPGRNRILQKTGTSHRFRFRFTNPLMQPFVVMEGLASGLISGATLNALSRARLTKQVSLV